MTTTDDLTARMIATNGEMIATAIAHRLASTPEFTMPDRPADRSRNRQRGFRRNPARRRFIL